jgi:hypothetical protein
VRGEATATATATAKANAKANAKAKARAKARAEAILDRRSVHRIAPSMYARSMVRNRWALGRMWALLALASLASSGTPPAEAQEAGVPARIRELDEDRWSTEGLPALSRDGRAVAIRRHEGDGLDSTEALVTVSVRTGRIVRTDSFGTWRAGYDFDDEELRQWLDEVRTRKVRADRYLTRRGFRSIPPLGETDHGANPSGWSVEDDGAWVTISDETGRERFHQQMMEPTERDEEDPCSGYGITELYAWRVDATHALLDLTSNPTPDECWAEQSFHIVTLAP